LDAIKNVLGDGKDSSRKRRTLAYVHLKFLSIKGSQYVKAWYLHHVIDYMNETYNLFHKDEIIRRLKEKLPTKIMDNIELRKEFQEVLDFVCLNWEEILKDFREMG